MALRWDVYEDQAGEWRWRAVAGNGKIVADGAEGYASKRNAERALAGFQTAVTTKDAAPVASLARRCACPSPLLSKTVTNLCTGCGSLR